MKIDRNGYIKCEYCDNKVHELDIDNLVMWKLTPKYNFVICPSCLIGDK